MGIYSEGYRPNKNSVHQIDRNEINVGDLVLIKPINEIGECVDIEYLLNDYELLQVLTHDGKIWNIPNCVCLKSAVKYGQLSIFDFMDDTL